MFKEVHQSETYHHLMMWLAKFDRSQCSHAAPLSLKNCPFSLTLLKSLSVKASSSVIGTATWCSYQLKGKSPHDSLYLRDMHHIKRCGHFWLSLPRSSCESELLLPQRNRRSIILGCLYFRGDPCTVPEGSCDEMSHHVRNAILKFSCHKKKVLLWLYSSTLTLFEKNIPFQN